MSLDPLTAALDIGGKLIDKLFPDPAQKAAAQFQLETLAQNGELAAMTAQTDINKIEAASSSVFTSGWRPFIGWICGIALMYCSMVEPIARFVAKVVFDYGGNFPVIDTTISMQVLFGLLGLGGMRSLEKIKGVAK